MRRFFRCRKKEEVWRNGNITAAPFGGTDGERERQDKKDTRQLADKPSAPPLPRSLSVQGPLSGGEGNASKCRVVEMG